jgi:hypothetical protein
MFVLVPKHICLQLNKYYLKMFWLIDIREGNQLIGTITKLYI